MIWQLAPKSIFNSSIVMEILGGKETTLVFYIFFLYKNLFYKNVEAEISPKI